MDDRRPPATRAPVNRAPVNRARMSGAPVNRGRGPSGLSALSGGVRVAAVIGLAAAVYLLFPVKRSVDGTGIIRPVFEQTALLRPAANGFVVRVDVAPLQRVEAGGGPLFTAVGARGERWSVRAAAGAAPADTTFSGTEAATSLEERRLAEQRAGNEWCGLALKASPGEPWEQQLCGIWSHRLLAQAELERLQGWTRANELSGLDSLNVVNVWDPVAGQYRPAYEGAPYPSDFTGTVLAVWVAPRMQIGPPRPVAEVMPDGTPLEVIGVIPAAARPALAGRELEGTIRPLGAALASRNVAVSGAHLGAASLTPAQVATLFGLAVKEPSVVVRVRLKAQVDPADVGRVARFELETVRQPRVWSWITGGG